MRIISLLLLATLIPVHAAYAYTLTLNGIAPSVLSTVAYDGAGGAVSEDINLVALPYISTSTSIDGAASAETAYNLSDTQLAFSLSDSRVGALGSFAQSYGSVYFNVDQNTDYVVSGSYTAVDAEGRRITFSAYIYDQTAGAYILNTGQESQSTTNESFTIGLSEGDFSNVQTGSLTGTLIAGHDYIFNYSALMHANPTAAVSSATASGLVTLDLTAFPESTTIPVDADRFLTYFNEVAPEHAESAVTSAAYHAAIDPSNERLTLNDWLTANDLNGIADAEAIYVNDADLGFGRHMFVKTHLDGRVSSYVKNHTDNTPAGDPVDGTIEEKILNAHNDINLLATVAMEYGPPPGNPGGDFYTRFYAFGADGNRILGADLDGRGEKFIPGVCTSCHGGNPRPLLAGGSYPDAGYTGAGFLPWDLDTLGFSNTLFGGLPIYSQASQEAVLKTMNQAVLATNPTDTAREVIEGWYGGAGTPNTLFDGDYVPPGWVGHEGAYLNVYTPNCRACHVMRNEAVSFRTYLDFTKFSDRAQHMVFDRGIMPLARRTYDRFWTGLSVSDPDVVDLFGAISTTRRPGTGVPFAFAGADSPAEIGIAKTLPGSKSSYASSFAWSILLAPPGSVATLDDPAVSDPSFIPDQPGEYLFLLSASNTQGAAQSAVILTVTADGGLPGVDFASEVVPVFETQCQSCHDGTAAPDFDGLGVALGTLAYTETVYKNLTGRVSVIDPTKSVLLQKPTNNVTHGGGTTLSTASPNYSLLLDWITEGAVRATSASFQQINGTIVNPIHEYTPSPFAIGGKHSYSGRNLEPFASLVGANLTLAFLNDADLSNSILSFALLTSAELSGADLSAANLVGATLSGAFLVNADLSNAAGVTAAQIESTAALNGVSLANLNLSGINLSGRFLTTANLSGTNLSTANLSNSFMNFTNLSNANLTGANLSGTSMVAANFNNAEGVTAGQIASLLILNDAVLTNLDLSEIDLSGRNLRFVDFSGSYLNGGNFTGADLYNANLSDANLIGADLTNASNLNLSSGSAFYNIETNFTGTGFDPVAAGWTLVAIENVPMLPAWGFVLLIALALRIGISNRNLSN